MLNLLIFNAVSINFVEMIIGLLLIIAVALLLILMTGITYTKEGYVSVIEKRHKFHKLEYRKFSYYFPIVFRKALYLNLDKNKIVSKDKTVIYYRVLDAKKLYDSKPNLHRMIEDENKLAERFEEIGLKLIFKSKK